VDQLVWNPLAHHNLTTFLKRKMPDPLGARIGVCVKGDSGWLYNLADALANSENGAIRARWVS
jgi:hypothetical protein